MSKNTAALASLGYECVGALTACVLIGLWADKHFETKGIFTALGAIGGFVGWVVRVVLVLRELAKNSDSSHTDGP
jgi:F0F1-type ATP synthase assembly protein I